MQVEPGSHPGAWRSPWATDIYQRALAHGCDQPHAVRVLARRDASHLAMLDGPRPLRPGPPRRRAGLEEQRTKNSAA